MNRKEALEAGLKVGPVSFATRVNRNLAGTNMRMPPVDHPWKNELDRLHLIADARSSLMSLAKSGRKHLKATQYWIDRLRFLLDKPKEK